MKKEIKLEISPSMFIELQGLIVNHVSKLIDKMEECRSKGAHSCANRYLSEINEWNDLDVSLDKIYNEQFNEE